jgi:hypothetical protein
MFWLGTFIFALIDAVYVPILAWRIKATTFREIKWTLVAVTGVFWGVIWIWMMRDFWDPVYQYMFPIWSRWVIPPVYGVLFAGVGLFFWWLALRVSTNPVVVFCYLGGLLGMVTHLWAVHLGIVDKPLVLQEVAPAAAVVVAVFEYMFYWCIILSLSSLLHPILCRLRSD